MSGGVWHIVLRLVDQQGRRSPTHGGTLTARRQSRESPRIKLVKGQSANAQKRRAVQPRIRTRCLWCRDGRRHQGRRSRDIVDKAITALLNLEHRGAAAPNRTAVTAPASCCRSPIVPARGGRFRTARRGSYATGIAFLPQSAATRSPPARRWRRSSRRRASTCWAGARCRPTTRRWARCRATRCRPSASSSSAAPRGPELERRAYVIRKRAEHELGSKGPGQTARAEETVYFPSLPVARSSTRAC
jgi:hypothetical protein